MSPQETNCPELFDCADKRIPRLQRIENLDKHKRELLAECSLEDFSGIQEDVRKLVRHWFDTALDLSPDGDTHVQFVRFINAWISFNCWAVCVTNQPDRERRMYAALASWSRLNQAFDTWDSKGAVSAFVAIWPIVNMKKARSLKKSPAFQECLGREGMTEYEHLYEQMTRCAEGDMTAVRQGLFKLLDQRNLLYDYPDLWAPGCFVYHKTWLSHPSDESDLPTDWPHVLNAIYQVRCNLFHGDKAAYARRDGDIVETAASVLVEYLKYIRYPHL